MNIPRPISLSLASACILTLLASCVEPPPGSESQIWQRAPRYGHGGTDPAPKPATKPKPGTQNAAGAGRFGYSGNDPAKPEEKPADATGSTMPTEREREPVATTEKPVVEAPKEEKKPSGPPSVSQMPFAKGVPGQPLSVTLPSPNDKLGPISIEQFEGGKPSGKPLPPGTPVEIPDPGNPGKKIYFRVP